MLNGAKKKKYSEFWNDCGAWEDGIRKGTTPKSYFILPHLKNVFLRKEQYCIAHQKDKKIT